MKTSEAKRVMLEFIDKNIGDDTIEMMKVAIAFCTLYCKADKYDELRELINEDGDRFDDIEEEYERTIKEKKQNEESEI